MKVTRKSSYAALLVGSAIATTTAQAASIALPDYDLVPNGLNETTTFQHTDVRALNDAVNVLPTVNGTVAYVVTTFTFGTASDAHLQWQFSTSATAANRIGLEVQDTGLVQTLGTGNGILKGISDTTPKRTSVNLATDMAGQSITLIAKLYFNSVVSTDLDARVNLADVTEDTGDDTIMNVWINPDGSDVEGDISSHAAMIGNGDMYAVWNSASFQYFRQTIQNQNTPGTSGTSTIGNTVILTGANATFANALTAAGVVPEPSAALLGGLGLLALLRRRR